MLIYIKILSKPFKNPFSDPTKQHQNAFLKTEKIHQNQANQKKQKRNYTKTKPNQKKGKKQ